MGLASIYTSYFFPHTAGLSSGSLLLILLYIVSMYKQIDVITVMILSTAAQELSEQQNIVACKTYEALQLQIWSLLPGFCTRPTDLAVVGVHVTLV